MKKQFLLIAAGAAMISLASCGGEEKKEDTAAETQAKVDSAVAAREAEMARVNDSVLQATVAAEKQRVADSMAAAEAAAATKKGGKKGGTKATPPATPTTPPPAPPAPTNPKENRFKDPKDQTPDPASTKKKEDRFK